MTFDVRTDRTLVRAGARSTRYILVSYTAPEAPARGERAPVNVALVLDRSGSMEGDRKFTLARDATKSALAMLRPSDRFTLVVYDTEIDTLAHAQLATATAKRDALATLSEIGPRGGTDLCGAWMTACEALAEGLANERVSRALLLTDGLANHGETDPERLAQHAAALRARGIATSTFGVGRDFDERLLEQIAHEGGGNFNFIASAEQIPEFLTGELGEALETTVHGANLEVTLPAGASATVLNRFRNAITPGGKLRVQLGDLASGQEVRVVIAVQFPISEPGERIAVGLSLAGDGAQAVDEEATLEWTYATHQANDRQTRNRVVDREVA
ncbi:MAG TPA: VWA domain-containing protein, partial [Gemmatimonas sp.]|nr:VWA domain-containing protein [Gemmatimonas sp.]